jgi:capsular polysaccharide export protein
MQSASMLPNSKTNTKPDIESRSIELPPYLGIVTWGIVRSMAEDKGWLGAFFAPSTITYDARQAQAVLAWGLKPSAERATKVAQRSHLPIIRLEDAFLRSVDFGPRERPLGICVDDMGIYYDASRPSRLEGLIGRPLSNVQRERSRKLINTWRANRVSKYNHAREYSGNLPDHYNLVIDQTLGDLSIVKGDASTSCFQLMLEAALEENPSSPILLKTHPEVISGRKRGHFDLAALAKNPRIKILGEDVHPVGLIEKAAAVYTVTSQVGFEALIWNKPVRTFGMPFYAGWGLTHDHLSSPVRRHKASLEQLVHAALVDYPRYVDPETRQLCEVEDIITHLRLQRSMREQLPSEVSAVGFSFWKRRHVRSFCQGSRVRFHRTPKHIPSSTTPLFFGRSKWAEQNPTPHGSITFEDGFLRSVGLGAKKTSPLSWVRDLSGIYYDARQPSDLENILNNGLFSTNLLERARKLRERICNEGITKYNLAGSEWARPSTREQVILVPGQVESDASIRCGSPSIKTNLQLLQAVRKAEPFAHLVFKPHPDVLAGARSADLSWEKMRAWCDEIVTQAPMHQLLERVDKVHTITSLAGFEALLRGRPVTTYGQPFYAGWGLTTDQGLSPEVATRRSRPCTIDEMVAAALILYPAYISRTTGRFTTPERALDELVAWRDNASLNKPWSTLLAGWRNLLSL